MQCKDPANAFNIRAAAQSARRHGGRLNGLAGEVAAGTVGGCVAGWSGARWGGGRDGRGAEGGGLERSRGCAEAEDDCQHEVRRRREVGTAAADCRYIVSFMPVMMAAVILTLVTPPSVLMMPAVFVTVMTA